MEEFDADFPRSCSVLRVDDRMTINGIIWVICIAAVAIFWLNQ